MDLVTPTTGNLSTTFVINNLAVNLLTALSNFNIDWGDGTDNISLSHNYSDVGEYTIIVDACRSSTTSIVSTVDVCVNPGIVDQVYFSVYPVSSYTGCGSTFEITFSALQLPTFYFYSSGSNSNPYQQPQNFWSHLKPQWRFTDENNNFIETISVSATNITALSTVGVSGTYTFKYVDDMPGSTNLFVTMEVVDAGINSRVYASVPHSIIALEPTDLVITQDGIRPINQIQWSGVPIPIVISVANLNSNCSNILHYTSGSLISANITGRCSTIDENIPLQTFELFDENCFSTGGYILTSITITAIPPISVQGIFDPCEYETQEKEYIRRYAMDTQIFAKAVVSDGVNNFTLTGISNTFSIYPFENFYTFRRHGESHNISDDLNYYGFTEYIKQHENLWKYSDAILDDSIDSLGTNLYYKIDQFVKNTQDLDRCDLKSLRNAATELDVVFEDYNLSFPNELNRIVELASLPFQKLIGTRCVCNTNFYKCENCCNTNVCKLCGFDKRTNIGDILSFTDYITAGTPILYRETGSQIYEIFNVLPQGGQNVFQLQTLTAQNFDTITDYCFYEWDSTYQNNPIESEIDYQSEFNMISPTVTSITEWYDENGILEEMINYTLTKGLELDS